MGAPRRRPTLSSSCRACMRDGPSDGACASSSSSTEPAEHVLAVSGLGSGTILTGESGLHVLERGEERQQRRPNGRPPDGGGERRRMASWTRASGSEQLLRQADAALAAAPPETAVVRRYRGRAGTACARRGTRLSDGTPRPGFRRRLRSLLTLAVPDWLRRVATAGTVGCCFRTLTRVGECDIDDRDDVVGRDASRNQVLSRSVWPDRVCRDVCCLSRAVDERREDAAAVLDRRGSLAPNEWGRVSPTVLFVAVAV